MSDDVTRHGEVHFMVARTDSDGVFERNGGYPAPKTPFEMPTMTPGPAQGTPTTGSDAQSQTSTTLASDD
jgi:hypothetical protein